MNILKQLTQPFSLIGFVSIVFFLHSCSNDMKEIQFFDRSQQPVQVLKNAEIVRSSNGNVDMLLTAPSLNKYEGELAKTEYPQGVFIQFFDINKRVKTSLSCKYAISMDSKRIMEARNNVVIIDYESGDTTYMESIIWDQNEKRIYSNKPLKSVNGSRVTYGDGFESDESFENPQIIRQRGTLEWIDEM